LAIWRFNVILIECVQQRKWLLEFDSRSNIHSALITQHTALTTNHQ
jgi:hypothetical protein